MRHGGGGLFLLVLFLLAAEMERRLIAINTSRAAFCRQWRSTQSFNESRLAPQAQPSTGGVIHILLIAGLQSAPLIDSVLLRRGGPETCEIQVPLGDQVIMGSPGRITKRKHGSADRL